MRRSLSLGTVFAPLAFVLAFVAPPAAASVVTSMDTETLVRLSAVIVRGSVESASVAPDDLGDLQTWITIRIDESLKGAAGRARIAVAVPGGTWGNRVSVVYGVPRFVQGERVVVFAAPTKAGLLTVTGLFQGKFRIERNAGAVEEAVPEGASNASVIGGDRRSREPLQTFLGRVREMTRRWPGPTLADGVLAEAPATVQPAAPAFHLINPLIPLRWFEPDNGLPISYLFNPASTPLAEPLARAGFAATVENWSHIPGTTVRLRNAGDTTLACRVFGDGSVISHGDPCGQLEPFDPLSCSGVLAVTGVSGFTFESKTLNGTSFLRLTETDTIFNAQTECFLGGSEKNYEETLSHELGHGIGLGHSCGDSFSGDCVPGSEADDALMRAVVHGGERGGAPRAAEVDGARFLYPTPAFVDLLLNQTTFHSGQTQQLTADLTGTSNADIYVLGIRPDGIFFSLAPGFPVNQVVPAAVNTPISFVTDVPLFSFTFTGSEPAGTYYWVAILARPGTNPTNSANWLSVDVATYTFTP